MSDKALLYEDNIGFFKPGHVFYPPDLRAITPMIAELNSEEIVHPKSFNANIRWYLDMIFGRFRSFHDTHQAAKDIYSAYRKQNAQYCLYLRNFSLAGQTIGAPRREGVRAFQSVGFTGTDRDFQKFVKASLPANINCLSFINTFELYPSNKETDNDYMLEVTIPSFRVLSHNWKEVVQEVVRGAKCIVLNVEQATEGIEYELELVRQCGMAGRTIVIGRPRTQFFPIEEFHDVIDVGISTLESDTGPGQQLAQAIRSLCSDGFLQTNEVADLSNLECRVVDRQIDLADRYFDAETRAGVPYDFYIPSSLATNWSQLTESFPKMTEQWHAIENKMAAGQKPDTAELAKALYSALNVLYIALTLERYYEMSIALSTMGMAHRMITKDIGIMAAFYRYATECAGWLGDEALRDFFANSSIRLAQEMAGNA